MTKLKRIVTSVMAATALATTAMGGLTASATYESRGSWDILVLKNTPSVPNQHSYYNCSFPAYSGGYQSYCSSISGSNDRKVSVTSNVGKSWTITTTGYSNVYTSTNGGTATFTFTGSCSNSITARGTIGYVL